ncbi:MAG: response regulator, partial [Desulfobacterales bacterium]|nr:response regulator [Desulfobacterales bacterium]
TLINQVLDLSKIEAGRATLDESNFDLRHLLDEMEDIFRLRAKKKGLELRFEHTPAAPRHVRTDKTKLRQVLINLIENAIKFTKEGAVTVKMNHCPLNTNISVEEEKNPQTSTPGLFNFQFTISDTGPGVAPRELNGLFEAFVQTRAGRESHKGTGLGLAISRKFIQLMGGDVKAESQVGRGTTFTFHIRAGVVEAAEIDREKPARKVIAPAPDQPRYRLLIVDDNGDNRKVIANLLDPFDFELREARNGREAVEIWKTWRPRLIWMDIRMPVMSGSEATRQIREAAARRSPSGAGDPIIIAVSAGAFEEERDDAISAGCDDFLRKPFQETELFDLMAKHLGIRYVYEERLESERTGEEDVDKSVLTPERLSALPEEWLAALNAAAETTDPRASYKAIDRIRERDTPLAAALAELVRKYRFDIIQELFEGRKGEGPKGR